MLPSDIRLPFLLSPSDILSDSGGNIDASIYRELPVNGMLRLEAEALCFQFRRKKTGWDKEAFENFFSTIFGGGSSEPKKEKKSKVEDICVPLEQIMKVTFKRSRWFQSKLKIHANDLRAFEQIPGGAHPRLILRITKEHADLAESLVNRLHLRLSEHTLRRRDDDRLGHSD